MSTALLMAGVAVIICAVIALFTGRVSYRTYDGAAAIGNFLAMAGAVAGGNHFWASFSAAVTAYCAWRWWTGGGGDDTRRRLRKAAKRFAPRRRTATTHA